MSQKEVLNYLKKKKQARSKEISIALNLSIQATVNALSKLFRNLEIQREKEGIQYIYKIKNGKEI